MNDITEAPTGHPILNSWDRYKETEDYINTKKWALQPEHVAGSLWAAFSKGFQARAAIATERERALVAALDRLVTAVGETNQKTKMSLDGRVLLPEEEQKLFGEYMKARAILAKHKESGND